MNNGNIKTLATIAMILQGLNVALGIGIVVLQRTLVSALMVKTLDSARTVFPITLVFMILQFLIYYAFYSISQKEGKDILVIVLIILSIVFSIISVVGDAIGSIFYSRVVGLEAVAMYSSVTTLVSYSNVIFGIPAAPLFYIACGQYTASGSSKAEKTED